MINSIHCYCAHNQYYKSSRHSRCHMLIWFIDAYIHAVPGGDELRPGLLTCKCVANVVIEELIDCEAVGYLCMFRNRTVYLWNIRSTWSWLHDLKLIAFLWVSGVNFLGSNVFIRHWLIIPSASTKLKCASVRLSVCGQNRVRSVSSTKFVGSIWYLRILSSNFRRCVACNVCFEMQQIGILANSLNF